MDQVKYEQARDEAAEKILNSRDGYYLINGEVDLNTLGCIDRML